MIEFNTGLAGLGNFCPSNTIAERLEEATRDFNRRVNVLKEKQNALKNGAMQAEVDNLEKEHRRLEKVLEETQKKLLQEVDIAKALGVNIGKLETEILKNNRRAYGLGIFCEDAVNRRIDAERAVHSSAVAYGEEIGKLSFARKRNEESLRQSRIAIRRVKQALAVANIHLVAVRKLIAKYKVLRTKTKEQQEQVVRDALKSTDEKRAIKTLTKKKNINMAIGGALALAGLVFIKLKN